MNDSHLRPTLVLAGVGLIVLLVLIYAGAYVALGNPATAIVGPRTLNLRIYSYLWQEQLFRPAAKAESLLTGREVDTAHRVN